MRRTDKKKTRWLRRYSLPIVENSVHSNSDSRQAAAVFDVESDGVNIHAVGVIRHAVWHRYKRTRELSAKHVKATSVERP